jgi:hypothetical protein
VASVSTPTATLCFPAIPAKVATTQYVTPLAHTGPRRLHCGAGDTMARRYVRQRTEVIGAPGNTHRVFKAHGNKTLHRYWSAIE